jgi:hypothetical protein
LGRGLPRSGQEVCTLAFHNTQKVESVNLNESRERRTRAHDSHFFQRKTRSIKRWRAGVKTHLERHPKVALFCSNARVLSSSAPLICTLAHKSQDLDL